MINLPSFVDEDESMRQENSRESENSSRRKEGRQESPENI